MSTTKQHLKILWGRAAGRCSYPGCHLDLLPSLDAGGDLVLGEMAHIIGKKPNAPRALAAIGEDDSYDNLVLLCANHHTLIDNAETDFDEETIRTWKADWESKVSVRLRSRSSVSNSNALEIRSWNYFNFDLLAKIVGKEFFVSRLGDYIDSELCSPKIGKHRKSPNTVFDSWEHLAGLAIQQVYSDAVEKLIASQSILDFDMSWGVEKLDSLLFPTAICFSNRGFFFRRLKNSDSDIRCVHITNAGVKLEFHIDIWNVFGNSARNLHFTGNSRVAAIFLVRSFERSSSSKVKLHVKATPIALGTGHWDIGPGF